MEKCRPTNAVFNDPSGIYVDASGSIFFSERRNHIIRKIAGARILTIAGNRHKGFSGNGKYASLVRLNYPEGLAGDRHGNVFVADSNNHRIRRISRDGLITTVAGTGERGFSGDGGPAEKAKLNKPFEVCVSSSGAIYVADWGNHRVRVISPEGIITSVAGTGRPEFSGDGGPADQAGLNEPYGIDVNGEGTVYVADSGNNRIRRICTDGLITTFAGTGIAGFSGDGGMALDAKLNSPQAVFVAPSGEVYINDEHNHRIRKVLQSGIIVTVAGNGNPEYCGDGGPATEACLNDPEDIWIDKSGNLFITDGDNHRIRKVNPNGIISTIAGSGPIGKR